MCLGWFSIAFLAVACPLTLANLGALSLALHAELALVLAPLAW